MLIEYGNTIVLPDWEIDEKEGTGYIRIYYIHGGEVTYTGAGQSCRLTPGGVYIMPNCIPYQVRRNDKTDFVCTYLHMNIPKVQVNGLIELLPKEDDSLNYFMKLITKLIDEKKIDLLRKVAEYIIYFCEGNENCTVYTEFMTKITKYIEEHISQKITIEELSALQHYNTNYFIEVFKKEANCTPYQYIIRARMQKAVQLLRDGKEIGYVATAVGYSDASSFCRVFERYYGRTPQKYLKSAKIIP